MLAEVYAVPETRKGCRRVRGKALMLECKDEATVTLLVGRVPSFRWERGPELKTSHKVHS